jgi:hypothetical protein
VRDVGLVPAHQAGVDTAPHVADDEEIVLIPSSSREVASVLLLLPDSRLRCHDRLSETRQGDANVPFVS